MAHETQLRYLVKTATRMVHNGSGGTERMSVDGQYTLETPENVEVDFELAGLGSRFCAMLIDSLMLFLLMLLLGGLLLALNIAFLGNLRRTFGPGGNRLGDWLTWVNALAILL